MSLFPTGFTLLQAAAAQLINPVFFLPRSIGGFVADITIEEQHSDELIITDHPVEQGATITDHAYKKPAGLIIRPAWSNSSIQSEGNPNYIQDVYNNLLELQASREPFDVITGKRFYSDMLMAGLNLATDEKTENALFIVVSIREIIIVQTQTVTVAPKSAQSQPESTNATVNRGSISITPTNTYNAEKASGTVPTQ